MKILCGLGNPGRQYEQNRHNIGFLVLEALAARWKLSFTSNKFEAELAHGTVGGQKVMLLKPQTFMNLSGQALGGAAPGLFDGMQQQAAQHGFTEGISVDLVDDHRPPAVPQGLHHQGEASAVAGRAGEQGQEAQGAALRAKVPQQHRIGEAPQADHQRRRVGAPGLQHPHHIVDAVFEHGIESFDSVEGVFARQLLHQR
jgi:hypothetical protein